MAIVSDTKPITSHTDLRVAQLRQRLGYVENRMRRQEAVSLSPLAVCLALGATVLLAMLARFKYLMEWPELFGAGALLIFAALITVALYAMLRPRDLMSTARRADRLLNLDERLSTALETPRKRR